MLKDNLLWIVNWFDSQCDGDWEHSNGVHIQTLGNPGWDITISIQETELDEIEFREIHIERTEKNWLFCKVEEGQFQAKCGVFNLIEVLQIFRNWAEGKGNIL